MANKEIKIEKAFPVTVEKLYAAWTEEDALKAWWQPAGRKLASVDSDLKEGGIIRYTFEDSEDHEGQSGRYPPTPGRLGKGTGGPGAISFGLTMN